MDRKTLRNGFATASLLTAGVSAIAWAQKSSPQSPSSAVGENRVVANGPMTLDEFEFSAAAPLSSAVDHRDVSANSIVLTQSTMLPPPQLPDLDPVELPSLDELELPARDAGNVAIETDDRASDSGIEVVPPLTLFAPTEAAPAKRDARFEEDPGLLRLPTVAIGRVTDESTDDDSSSAEQRSKPAIETGSTSQVLRDLSVAPPPIFYLEPVPSGSPKLGARKKNSKPEAWSDEVYREDDGLVAAPPSPDFPGESSLEAPALPLPNDDVVIDDKKYEFPETARDAGLELADSNVVDGFEQFSASWNASPDFAPTFNDQMLMQFGDRFGRFVGPPGEQNAAPMPSLPGDMTTWWTDTIPRPLRPSKPSMPIDVQSLVLTALQHSPDILAYQLDPEITRKGICEEQAAFDWTAFSELTYDDVNDPVGNTLTTGGADRFKDRIASGSGGVRRRNDIGGEFEVNHRFGWQDNNSDFFVPNQQATTRLTVSYTQPLLNQRGKAYQQSRTVLAMLETGATEDDTADRIQDHLLDVSQAYWQLYRARAMYLQQRNLLGEAERILATLEGRSTMDTVPRQLLRAKSAVLLRRSEITRAAMDIRNAESRLRLLVGDPRMTSGSPLELLPVEPPVISILPVNTADAARTAMAYRPDIRQAVKKVRSTGVRVGITENELLPRLDLVFNGYVSGLEGDGQMFRSLGSQFADGRPSFAAGMLFEIPLGNRAAKARHHRRQLEMVQATHELESVVETGLTEVEMAVRELQTSHREMVNRYESMAATAQEMDYLRDRWNLLPGGSSTTQLLEDLLDAQERLADDEGAFVTAQVNYVLATASLRRAMGTLLQVDAPGCPSSPLMQDALPTMAEPMAGGDGL